MWNRIVCLLVGVLTVVMAGCGELPTIPKFNEDHTGLAPWEKLPEEGGLVYLEKLTVDPGMEPHYLALMQYETDADLQRVVYMFGLTLNEDDAPIDSWVDFRSNPTWYPLRGAEQTYSYPLNEHQYVCNLWVDSDEKLMILERSWW